MLSSLFFDLLALCGWVLGIIGFFRAGAARAELRELRRMLVPPEPRPSAPVEPIQAPTPAPPTPIAPTPIASVPETHPHDPLEPPPKPQIAPTPPEPTPAPEPIAAPARDIEALLTLRWGVWLGSAALLFAGIFLVRYAVERALLGPAARCGLAALLGATMTPPAPAPAASKSESAA